MKYIYVSLQRSTMLCLILLWLVALASNSVYAQQKAGYESGVVRIKVKESLALQLENARMTKSSNNILVTGIQSIDRLSLQYKATGIKRVFRHAGKFEAKHRKYGLHRWFEIQLDKAAPILAVLSAYQAIEQIEIAQPLYTKAIIGSDRMDFGPRRVDLSQAVPMAGVPNDPLFAQQWHYNNTGQASGTPGSDISILQAWGIETGTSNVIVAVTDGGAQVDHPDLAANMWVNTDEIPGNGLDDDNNGYVDDINGYGFGDNTGEIAPDDHGTHTSGTVAATTNNAIGVAGVAGGSGIGDGVRIMSCAAFGAVGVGGFEDTYVYGADNGAVISQNSWGYTNPGVFDQSVIDAIDYFIAEAGKDEFGNQVGPMNGGIVIFAAGNDDNNDEYYPGYYDATLAVSGVTNQDKKAWYSNFGEWVDLAAPGGETFVNNDPQGVLSTVSGGQYAFFQGTSMACPHVSGVAALIVSKFGGVGFTPEMLRGRLTQLVDDIDAADPPFAGLLGSGRLNAFSALQENDGDAPDAIDDLSASVVAITDVTLTWTSPADPGNGSASVYDVRYSTSLITEDNFDEATSLLNPPAPKPAGETEVLTISGLLPGTVYYFAIKSADFFGNFSSVSNILQQPTNFAPVIALSSTTLTQDLQTAQTASQILTISNTGLGVLNFSIFGTGGFASVAPTSGSVSPGESLDVTVTFNANNLLSGTYNQDIEILHNDPLQDSLVVHLVLNVTNNGFPIASVIPDTLNLGRVIVGAIGYKDITVRNGGSEVLQITEVTSDNPGITSNFPGLIQINPLGSGIVGLYYSTPDLGVFSGHFRITTNDPVNPVLSVYVIADIVYPPAISVTPDSLSAVLHQLDTTTQVLTIANTGGDDLYVSLFAYLPDQATTTITSSSSSVRNITIPVKATTSINTGQKYLGSNPLKYDNQVVIQTVKTPSDTSRVLLLSPDDDVTDLATILNTLSSQIEATIFPKASLPDLTLADLLKYDVVLTTNNTQWLAAGGIDPASIGDMLADYIDSGGKVIVNQFAYSYDAWKMGGRFIDENYGPFTPSTSDEVVDVELGFVPDIGHPVIWSVNLLSYSGYVQNVGLAPGATVVAEWDNGELFVAANRDVVALNMLPSLGNGGAMQWSGYLALLYANSITYLTGIGSNIQFTPGYAIVPPGESQEIKVKFDAGRLDAGVYPAMLAITHSGSADGYYVPTTLTVLPPEFTISPDSLYDELENQQTSTHTLVLSNNGPDDHSFTVAVQGSGFSTSSVKITKPASAARVVTANPDKQKQSKSARKKIDKGGVAVLSNASESARTAQRISNAALSSVGLYATDFEDLSIGDINGQDGWFGQWANWTVQAENPSGGAQHFRGLADGFGFSFSLSPAVPIGSESISTASMKVNLQGLTASWQIAPQSPSAGLIITRIGFETDGTMVALVSDGAGGGFFETIATTIPTGYFDLTISSNRASAMFDVYIDDVKIFTGLGFAGDIEQVAVVGFMEEAGPTLDIDDLQIIDGAKEAAPEFITVSPLSGNLPSGAIAEITVNFASEDLTFGLYSTNIKIDIDGTTLTVPASLRVIGDEAIDVDPTVLQAVVDYKGDTTQFIHIANTGGRPLSYGLQVIGASTDMAKLPKGPVSKFANWPAEKRIADKKAKDDQLSKVIAVKSKRIELLAGSSLLDENFDGGTFPPTGWSTTDNTGEGVVWGFAADVGEGNYSGVGEAATISSDAFGPAEFDAELISPAISTAGFKNIAVQYNVNYANYLNLDFLDLDIQVDGGAWTNVISWNEDHGTFRGTPGEFVSASLDSYLTGASSFRLRWHYYDPNDGDWDWYAQIDDVVILGDARAWLTVDPVAGIIPVGESVDVAVQFEASDLDPGFYVAGILVSSNAVEDPLIGVVASLDVREPAVISVDPDSVYVELPDELMAQETLIISNSGESVLTYSITDAPIPAASRTAQLRRESLQKRTTPVNRAVNLLDAKAIQSTGVSTLAGTSLYSTGFEEFALGDIDDQEGWNGQFGNWTIENFNPALGSQHFSGLADGLGQSLAFSPIVAMGNDDVSTTSMKIDLDLGVTWQIIPQSPTEGFVNTRFQISADGSLSALVQDSVGTIFYQNISGTLPDGYFDLRIEIKRSTLELKIYVNDALIFTGKGLSGDIEQVVIFSLMEDAGQYLDIDNFSILDGPAQAPWLTVEPKAGAVGSGSSSMVTLSFDATDVEPGTYTKTLNVSSNDPATPNISVPVTLVVLPNLPPVLSAVNNRSVRELSTLNLLFTATDPDDSLVTVSITNSPSFVTLTSSGNGLARYLVKPLIGDAGSYEIVVTAVDARGGIATKLFTLEVIPYGVQNFSLIYWKTGALVRNFEDTVTLDVADPDIDKYTIRANTNPGTVGSVKFSLDGKMANTDNSRFYTINNWLLPVLSGGDHSISAQAFTKSNGSGEAGQVKWGTIKMINSAAITDFDVVNGNGVKLLDLQEGDIIDIAQPGFSMINLVANTSTNMVRSVKFTLNGPTARIDNTAPYALKGNANGSNTYWQAKPGYYTLTAVPYMKSSAWGPEGTSLTIHFQVISGVGPTVANARTGGDSDTEEISEEIFKEETSDPVWSVYPVPVKDELHIRVQGKVEGKVSMNIINLQGQSLHTTEGNAEFFRDYTVSTVKLGLNAGVYVIHIQQANGKRVVQKFMKE